MRTLALIPARSGSKGIPNKNFRDFCGKPLWVWAYEAGKKTCEDVRVSSDTTESKGMGWEVGLLRPKSLCQDDTPMLSVIQHALSIFPYSHCEKPDVVVLLQPTQPLRQPKHVLAALQLLEETGADSVVSVVEIPAHHSPDYAMEIAGGRLFPLTWWKKELTRRQDARWAYSRDGTVYVTRREVIEGGSLYGDDCCPLIIPHSESCNIDTEEDWRRAEAMMKERINGQRQAV